MLTKPHPPIFSRAMLTKRCKAYFQCLIAMRTLFDKGLTRFPHSGRGAFYALLLHSPTPGAVSMADSAAILEEQLVACGPAPAMLADSDGFSLVASDHEGCADDSDIDGLPNAKAVPRRSDSDDGLVGSEVGSGPPSDGDGHPPPCSPCVSGSESSSSPSSSESAVGSPPKIPKMSDLKLPLVFEARHFDGGFSFTHPGLVCRCSLHKDARNSAPQGPSRRAILGHGDLWRTSWLGVGSRMSRASRACILERECLTQRYKQHSKTCRLHTPSGRSIYEQADVS